MNNKDLGNLGEELAANYLKVNGYEILKRNYRSLFTEIDIVALEEDNVVFVEVKTRRSREFGDAFESVNDYKIKNIIQTARAYVHEHNLYNLMVRFDIIEVYWNEKKINHIKSAFDVC